MQYCKPLQCDHQTPAFLDSLMMCHADVLPVFLHGIYGLNCFSCFHVLDWNLWRSQTSGSAGLGMASWLWSWLIRHLRHPTHHTDRHKNWARVNSRGTCGCATCCQWKAQEVFFIRPMTSSQCLPSSWIPVCRRVVVTKNGLIALRFGYWPGTTRQSCASLRYDIHLRTLGVSMLLWSVPLG